MVSPVPLNVTFGPDLSCDEVRHSDDSEGDHEMTCYLEANPPLRPRHVRWTTEDGKTIGNDENFNITTTEKLLKVSRKVVEFQHVETCAYFIPFPLPFPILFAWGFGQF